MTSYDWSHLRAYHTYEATLRDNTLVYVQALCESDVRALIRAWGYNALDVIRVIRYL